MSSDCSFPPDTEEVDAQEFDDEYDSSIASPPPQYPASDVASQYPPPPFSSLYSPPPCSSLSNLVSSEDEPSVASGTAAPAYAPLATEFLPKDATSDTKKPLIREGEGQPSTKVEDPEPPPAYSEGPSPLHSFTYLMAVAGGAASIITQVQQGGPPINSIGGEQRHFAIFFSRLHHPPNTR